MLCPVILQHRIHEGNEIAAIGADADTSHVCREARIGAYGLSLFVSVVAITVWAFVVALIPVPLAVIFIGLGSMLYYVAKISHDSQRGKARSLGLALLRIAGATTAVAGTVILLTNLTTAFMK